MRSRPRLCQGPALPECLILSATSMRSRTLCTWQAPQHLMSAADAPLPMLLQGAYNATSTSGACMHQTVLSAFKCCRPLTRSRLLMQHMALSPAAILCRKAQATSMHTQMHTSLMQVSLWGQGCPLWGQGCPLCHLVRLTRGTATCLFLAFRCLASVLEWLLRAALAHVVQSCRHKAAVLLWRMLRWSQMQVRDCSLFWMGAAK